MEIQQKLRVLADAAKYDASCASSGSKRARVEGGIGNTDGVGICHSYTPDGRCVSLLKLLLTNYCIYDCSYCVNRISSDTQRARFTPEEVVFLTIEFYKRNYIEGLFLSSGIIQSPDYTMEQLIRVAKASENRSQFRRLHSFEGRPRCISGIDAAGGGLGRPPQCQRRTGAGERSGSSGACENSSRNRAIHASDRRRHSGVERPHPYRT